MGKEADEIAGAEKLDSSELFVCQCRLVNTQTSATCSRRKVCEQRRTRLSRSALRVSAKDGDINPLHAYVGNTYLGHKAPRVDGLFIWRGRVAGGRIDPRMWQPRLTTSGL